MPTKESNNFQELVNRLMTYLGEGTVNEDPSTGRKSIQWEIHDGQLSGFLTRDEEKAIEIAKSSASIISDYLTDAVGHKHELTLLQNYPELIFINHIDLLLLLLRDNSKKLYNEFILRVDLDAWKQKDTIILGYPND